MRAPRAHPRRAAPRLWARRAWAALSSAWARRPARVSSAHTRSRPYRSPFARAFAAVSWAYLCTIVAITLVLWTLSDRWWPATILLFSGRWIFLTPLLLLVPLGAAAARRSLVPLLLAAVIGLGPLMGARIGWHRWLLQRTGQRIRVVSFNAEGGRLAAARLPDLMAEWQADVASFQECGDELAAATREMRGWAHDQVGGNCLLSRFPIVERAVMNRDALLSVRRDAAAIGGSGLVVRYRLQTPTGVVNLTNLHLETPRKGLEGLLHSQTFDLQRLSLNTLLRDVESDLARRFVEQGGRPLIVTGDFNTPSESRIFQEHWGDLRDGFAEAGLGLGMTKYNGWIRVRIDHVLTDASVAVLGAFVAGDEGSDHRPLVVDVALQESR